MSNLHPNILKALNKGRKSRSQQCKEDYNSNPIVCKNCRKVIPYKPGLDRRRKFCGSSCAALYNNQKKIKICDQCSNQCRNDRKFCSHECRVESIKEGRHGVIKRRGKATSDRTARRYLLETGDGSCETCNRRTWLGQPISLTIDHIDGNPSNHSLENIRLICWNCHAQTETFGIKNKGNGRKKRHKNT